MIILGCFGGTTIRENTYIELNTISNFTADLSLELWCFGLVGVLFFCVLGCFDSFRGHQDTIEELQSGGPIPVQDLAGDNGRLIWNFHNIWSPMP